MKNILLLAISGILLFTSCRYSECTNPGIGLSFEFDSSGALVFKFDTYEKGSGFSKLLSSEQDSAYIDTVNYYDPHIIAKHLYVDDKYDYIINITATGKMYKISDISFSGKKRVRARGLVSENKTTCTRTIDYTVNGQTFTVEGGTYEYGYSYPEPIVIKIAK